MDPPYVQIRRQRQDCDFDIDAASPFTLPGVQCDVCGQWWTSLGIRHPGINAVDLGSLASECVARSIPWQEYTELEARVRNRLGPNILLRPGTQFGALVGRVHGPLDVGVAWCLTAILLSHSTIDALQDLMPEARLVPTELRPATRVKERFYDVHAPFVEAVAARVLPASELACAQCGRSPGGISSLVVVGSAIPVAAPFVRLARAPGVLLVRESIETRLRALNIGKFDTVPIVWE